MAIFVKCSEVFPLLMFSFNNYVSLRYMKLSLGNRTATFLGKGFQLCLPFVLFFFFFFFFFFVLFCFVFVFLLLFFDCLIVFVCRSLYFTHCDSSVGK